MSRDAGKRLKLRRRGILVDDLALLPSCRSANAMASCDPMASPSGLAWDVITNRCR